MLRLIYQLIVQRAKQSKARRHALRQQQASQKQPARPPSRSRWIVLCIVTGVLVAFTIIVFRSQFEFSTLTTDPSKAQMKIQLGSVNVAPVVIYLEQSPPPLLPVPENDDVNQIIIENNQFIPTFQVVSAGSTIEIVNRDNLLHNAHLIDGGDTVFNVATPLTSISVRKVIKATGMLNVRCDLHPFMHGWIFVPSNLFFEVVREPKTISWVDITPGQYRLRVWEAGIIRQDISVTLAASERKTVDVL